MESLNLLDLAHLVRTRWLRLGAWAVGFAVAAYLVSYLVPSVYEARAVILPPDEDDLTSALSGGRRGLAGLAGLSALSRLGSGSYFTQEDVALATLRSRTLRQQIIQQFDLGKVYKLKKIDDIDATLRDKSKIVVGNDGTITVLVRDHSPTRAADMANAYFTALDNENRIFRTATARRTRKFLEQRVTQTDSTLRAAEARLTRYQGQHGSIVLPPDASGASQAGAALLAEQLRAEVDLAIVGSYANPQSEEYRRALGQVEKLRSQIGALPETQTGAAELVRQVALQQQILGLLSGQLEDARLREVMDTPTIQVLDWAQPPTRRTWPKRGMVAAFGLLVGLGLCGILEWRRLGASTPGA